MVEFKSDYLPYYKPNKLIRILADESPKRQFDDHISEFLANKYEEIINELGKDKKIFEKDRKAQEDLIKKENSEKEKANKEEKEESQVDKKQKKKRIFPYYTYAPPQNVSYKYSIYTPGGIEVIRVPSVVLGPNVLGRAFLGTNRVEILNTLTGLEFEEVKRHELNHILFPYLGEWAVRAKTKRELPFEARYH